MTTLIRKRRFESAWTAREDQQLRLAYRTTETAILAERFGRSKEAIRVRAKRIGAASPRHTRERPWTEEELRILQESKFTYSKTARILGRSRSSVSWKLWHLRVAA